VLKRRLYRTQRPRINRPLTCFVIYSTEVVDIVGLFAIGIMVQQAKTAHIICIFWLIKLAIGMPSQRVGTTIDRATISLDSARRESWKPLPHPASGTLPITGVARQAWPHHEEARDLQWIGWFCLRFKLLACVFWCHCANAIRRYLWYRFQFYAVSRSRLSLVSAKWPRW